MLWGLLSRLAGAAMLAFAAGSCAPATVPDDGQFRIVSLNPCTDAVLVQVARPGQIVALSHYSRDPAASSMDVALARRFGVTGGTAEEVIALQPDLVLASSFLPPATRAAFERLGIAVEGFGIASNVEESTAQIRRIAMLAGQPERGEALVGAIDEAVRAAAPAPPVDPIRVALWQEGAIVPGEATLIDDLLARTGFASDTARRGLGQGAHVSLEAMLADPPELLLVAGGDRALHHPALAGLPDTARADLPGRLLYCGGPSIIEALDYLAKVRRDYRARDTA